ncbi:hypothetical protein LCGC14_3056090 [marine sediment metagenome]|uniref:Uncharacterized protein n=1 Tax=marine sediment metagenome TaxID=412755 RepID=A0A0F8WK71_9ZZZZ
MKKLDVPRWIILTLLLTLLIANGCAVSNQQLLGSPNFVQENLPHMLSLEEEAGKIVAELQMLSFMGFSAEKDLKEMQGYFNTYWVYYNAANTYLSSGDRDFFVQAIARAEHALQKVRDVLSKISEGFEDPAPETKPRNLSL